MKKVILSLLSIAVISLLIFSEVQAQTPDDKLSPSMAKLLKTKLDQERVKVAIWLYTDSIKAADAVAKRYPRAKLLGQRPTKETDLSLYEQISREMDEAKLAAYRASQLPIEGFIRSRGFEVIFSANTAPIVFAELPKVFILELAQRKEIDTIYESLRYVPAMDMPV